MKTKFLMICLCGAFIGMYGEWRTTTCHSNTSDRIWIFPSYLAGELGIHCYFPDTDEDGTFR